MPVTVTVIDVGDKKARKFLNQKVLKYAGTTGAWVARFHLKDTDSSGVTRMAWFTRKIEGKPGDPDEHVEVGITLAQGVAIPCDLVLTNNEARLVAKMILANASFYCGRFASGSPAMLQSGVVRVGFYASTPDNLDWAIDYSLYSLLKDEPVVDTCISSGPFAFEWKPPVMRGLG